ncbi:hypothetical protein [Flavobacterium sp.]|uniref:hypothetical protein n=1 Tax=Flavobacterium sp. TaxID=239 RepID=UPI00333E747D
MKKVLLLTVLLFSTYMNAQWKFDEKKTNEMDLGRNFYTCKIGSIEIEKITEESSSYIDFETTGGLIEMYRRNLDRGAGGDGFFINTKGILDEVIRNPEKKYTVSIIFTDGTIIKDNKAIHSVTEADPENGFPSSNYVEAIFNKSVFIFLRDKLIKEIIIDKQHIAVVNAKDIKKAAGIVWYNAKP